MTYYVLYTWKEDGVIYKSYDAFDDENDAADFAHNLAKIQHEKENYRILELITITPKERVFHSF